MYRICVEVSKMETDCDGELYIIHKPEDEDESQKALARRLWHEYAERLSKWCVTNGCQRGE
jgi:hypothetical protein